MDLGGQRAETLAAYERLADVWDDTDDNLWNEALERATVRRLLPTPLGGRRVLDAGCASGAHAAWLADQGCRVIGFDLSPRMVAQARARLGSVPATVAPTASRLLVMRAGAPAWRASMTASFASGVAVSASPMTR